MQIYLESQVVQCFGHSRVRGGENYCSRCCEQGRSHCDRIYSFSWKGLHRSDSLHHILMMRGRDITETLVRGSEIEARKT